MASLRQQHGRKSLPCSWLRAAIRLNLSVRPISKVGAIMQRCIRCDGDLEKGFVLDRDGSSRTRQTRWVNGEPDDSFGTGLWNRAAAQNIPTDRKSKRLNSSH